jgi:hypothetical protein
MHLLTFEKAGEKAKSKLAKMVGGSNGSHAAFELYKEVVPRFKKSTLNSYHYRITYSIVQSLGCPYTYWMNDRISRIREISVDASELSDSHRSAVKVHRFMAASRWKAEMAFHQNVCVMPMNFWSVPGDGIVVTWFDDAKQSK